MELTQITAREGDFALLFARMDADRMMAHATAYTLNGIDGKPLKGAASVTLPTPKQFADKCAVRLTSVKRQTTVKSYAHDTEERLEAIENFLDDLSAEADNLLVKRGELPEFNTLAEMVNLRGPVAERVLLRRDKDLFVPDIRPLDTRYYTYDLDNDGIVWDCYTTTRLKSDIESEYEVKVNGKTAVVRDVWDRQNNYIFIDGALVKTQKNPYGYVPSVLAFPATGSNLKDLNAMQYRAESIFALTRDDLGRSMFDEANRIASILKTMSYSLIDPALQYRNPEGGGAVITENPATPGAVTPIPQTAQFELVPQRDITNAARYDKQITDTALQIATFTLLDFGSTGFPLSAVAMANLTDKKNESLLPRLNAIMQLLQGRSRMAIKQVVSLGSVELGEEGHKRKYKSSDLSGQYTISFQCWSDSTQDIAASASIAAACRGLLSEETIRKDILKIQDPEAEDNRLDREAVLREDPIAQGIDRMLAFIDKAGGQDGFDNLMAWNEFDKVLNLIERRKLDKQVPLANTPVNKTPPANANAVPSLFQGGGSNGQSQQEAMSAQ